MWRFKRWRNLRLPPDIGYYRFRAFISGLFIAQGWTAEQSNHLPFPILARKDGNKVLVVCLDADYAPGPATMKDLLDYTRSFRGQTMMFVTFASLSRPLRQEAVARDIALLDFRDLANLLKRATSNAASIKAFCRECSGLPPARPVDTFMPAACRLAAAADTHLKRSPEKAGTLPEKNRLAAKKGSVVESAHHERAGDHIKLFDPKLNGAPLDDAWYIYAAHWKQPA